MMLELTRNQFRTIRSAVHWLFPIYTNEFMFLLGLPIFLLDPPSFKSTTGEPPLGFVERMKNTWKVINNRESRHALLLSHYDERLYNRYIIIQMVLWLVGAALKFPAYAIMLNRYRLAAPKENNAVHDYVHILLRKDTGYLLLAAFVIHYTQYVMHVFHYIQLMRTNKASTTIVNFKWYFAAHFGLINFYLDLPGFSIPDVRLSHTIILLINIIAVTMFLFMFMAEDPMVDAWGCYPSWYSYTQYDEGLCPKYLSKYNPETALSAVCTTVPGARCDTEAEQELAIFRHTLFIGFEMFAISFLFYIMSIFDKVGYYTFANREMMLVIYENHDNEKKTV